MKTLVKNTKTKTYFNFNNEIFKTSNNFGDRNFEIVDFEKLQKDQVTAIQSPYKWVNLGDFENLDAAYTAYIQDKLEERDARKEENDKFMKQVIDKMNSEWDKIKDLETIPTTVENLRIVLDRLNSQNWGLWRLPKMEIGYVAQQYDCDGKTATTIKLDYPISDEDEGIENEKLFKVGGKRGHLNNYRSI